LGLAISKKLVELLGGKIWVKSEYQKGAAFYFTHPFKQQPFKSVSQDVEPVTILQGTYSWPNKAILLVEDENTNYLLFKAILEVTNAKIHWLSDGREVVALCKNQRIDLVLMDIQLPGMNGLDATRDFKKNNSIIPVIAQTAFASAGEKEKCLEAGCDDYISKPFDIAELLQMIDKHI